MPEGAAQPANASRWRRYLPVARHAARLVVATLATHAAAVALDLPQGYWAVMSAVLVIQVSIGATVIMGRERLLGTLLGAAIGVVVSVPAAAEPELRTLALASAIALAGGIAMMNRAFRLAPVTAAIVLLSDPSHADPLVSALHRVLDIGIGTAIGLVVSLVVFPARAGRALVDKVADTLPLCGRAMGLCLSGLIAGRRDGEALDALNSAIRAGIAAAETSLVEVQRETMGPLVVHSDPAALIRHLRRLWHSVVMLERATVAPLPPAIAARLSAALGQFGDATASDLDAIAAALRRGTPLPPLRLDEAVRALDGARARLWEEGLAQGLAAPAAVHLSGLFFALDQVPGNVRDLADRAREVQGRGAVADA